MARPKRPPLALGYALVVPGEPDDALALQEGALERVWRERYATTHAWGGCCHDEGDAVTLQLGKRPGGLRLKGELQQDDVALFISPDRAFAGITDFHQELTGLHRRGVRALVLSLELDTGGDFWSRYLGLRQSLERVFDKSAVHRLKVARAVAVAVAVAPAKRSRFQAPYGFWWQCRKNQRPRLMRDCQTRRCMSLVLQWEQEHCSARDIVDRLNAQGLLGRNGYRWTVTRMQRCASAERELRKDEVGAFHAAQRLEQERWAAEALARQER